MTHERTASPGRLQAVIDALPRDGLPAVIRLTEGVFREKIVLDRPHTALVGYDGKGGPGGQIGPPTFDLRPEALRLVGVAGREYHMVPRGKRGAVQAALIVRPRVLLGLGQIEAWSRSPGAASLIVHAFITRSVFDAAVPVPSHIDLNSMRPCGDGSACRLIHKQLFPSRSDGRLMDQARDRYRNTSAAEM